MKRKIDITCSSPPLSAPAVLEKKPVIEEPTYTSLDESVMETKRGELPLFEFNKYFNKTEFTDFELIVKVPYTHEKKEYSGGIFYLARYFISQMQDPEAKEAPMLEWIRDKSTSSLTVCDFSPKVYERMFR